MPKRLTFVLAALAVIAGAAPARAQHFAETQGVAAQTYLSYADVPLAAAAPPVQVLPVNPNRVTAVCQNTGTTNTARVGDVDVGANQGTMLYADGAGVTFDVTSAIYAYSQGGTTINCAEIVRP
jgi:hypothetical protein